MVCCNLNRKKACTHYNSKANRCRSSIRIGNKFIIILELPAFEVLLVLCLRDQILNALALWWMKETAAEARLAESLVRSAGCCTISCTSYLHSKIGHGTYSAVH